MPILFRGTAGLNGTLQCHPEEAQAFVHESLPTKDLCTKAFVHESLPTKDLCISKSRDSAQYRFG